MRAWHRAVFAAALVFVAALSSPAAQPPNVPSIVAAIEATYLYKFAAYVEWPKGTFSAPGEPLDLCIVGNPDFGALVARAAKGTTIDRHPIVVHDLAAPEPDVPCHIMYLAPAIRPTALDAAHGTSILTVTAKPRASRHKGIINFIIQNDHVRFEIDDAAAQENHLKLSSQLLALAINRQTNAGH